MEGIVIFLLEKIETDEALAARCAGRIPCVFFQEEILEAKKDGK
ncbi:MAG: hypothetical protein ABSB40_08270 [Nitrososphaeria archaeon]|jgi:hypothetical protein